MTKDAAVRLVEAHVALARAEAVPILENVKGVAVAAGLAVGFGIFAALVVIVGMPLFLGEWLFGSLGWGIVHGAALGVAIIAICAWMILVAEPAGVARAVAIGIIVGLVVGFIARAIVPGPDPLSVGATIVLGIVGSFIGGFLGWALFGKDLEEGALQPSGLIGSLVGAVIALLLYNATARGRGTASRI
jgi:uncharacterized membrane protein YeaQ/YmgE (transglycosylase-associated protein family)